ncbi:MAG: hypothetical protein ACOWW1_04460 [archaeon]
MKTLYAKIRCLLIVFAITVMMLNINSTDASINSNDTDAQVGDNVQNVLTHTSVNSNLLYSETYSTSSYSDDFSLDSDAWEYFGSAYRDETDQRLVLTTSEINQGGAVFFKAPIQGQFTATFRYKSSGGDGFIMFFYKQAYSSIGKGGSLGFTTENNEIIPGYGIEFDGWRNSAYDAELFGLQQSQPSNVDPSSSHIALIEDYAGKHLAYVGDDRVEDNEWHSVIVEVQASSVTVFVDQELVLEWEGALNRTYSDFGFSGANGSDAGWHIIDDFSINAGEVKKSHLTVSCKGSASISDFSTQIEGHISVDGKGIPDAPIKLRYSVNGGKTWNDLTYVYSDSNGYYSAIWLPSVTGNYLVVANYEGKDTILGTSSEIANFAVTNFAEKNTLFSISSNSTVSSLEFNSTSLDLNFIVSGPEKTKGYVECTIAKSLVSDPENIKLFLDGNQLTYELTSKEAVWILSFTYTHSSHRININLPVNAQAPIATNNLYGDVALTFTIILGCIILVRYLWKNK